MRRSLASDEFVEVHDQARGGDEGESAVALREAELVVEVALHRGELGGGGRTAEAAFEGVAQARFDGGVGRLRGELLAEALVALDEDGIIEEREGLQRGIRALAM